MPAWWGWAPSALGAAFCFALGAAIGSFLNVVAYRLPKGEGLFSPPSRCPHCETHLRWRQNLPIFGWIMLGGKCRFCRSPISIQYPIVELITALIFAFIYAAWFGESSNQAWFGGALSPEWAEAGIARMWPSLMLVYVLIAGLIAMTLIDARTFMIPLSIPWVVTAAALVAHPVHAALLSSRWTGEWTIPTPSTAPGVWASLGGLFGVIVCAALLKARIIPRSFADFDQWAAEAQRKEAEAAQSDSPEITGGEAALGPLLLRVFYFTAPTVSLMAAGFALGLRLDRPFELTIAGTLLGLVIGMFLRRIAPGSAQGADTEPDWIRYPHARRESLKELLCLACIGVFAFAGWWLGAGVISNDPPLWLRALAGASLGYLSGGAVVWLVRIFGTLGFGKEAMGMGDVHLLAAVGAVLGWLDPILAFFTAPFFGLSWVLLAAIFARRKGVAYALPFGPHLAAGTLAVLIAWPIYARLLGALLPASVSSP
jgi:prepilin signal peptidase PulO-like enzyme (type II secretory pathway)